MTLDEPGIYTSIRPLIVPLIRSVIRFVRAQEDFLAEGTHFDHLLADSMTSAQQLRECLSSRDCKSCKSCGFANSCNDVARLVGWHLANTVKMNDTSTKMRASVFDHRIAGSDIPDQVQELAELLKIDTSVLSSEKDDALPPTSSESSITLGDDFVGMDTNIDQPLQSEGDCLDIPASTARSTLLPALASSTYPFDGQPTWRYEQLYGSEIRLLTLGDATDAVLQCQLITVPSVNTMTYTALSYTWGDGENTAFILVNGARIQVRNNLAVALRRLRERDVNCLWVDALCINQEDLTERNHQVRMMGQIYSRAVEVIAWLGDPTPKSALALDWLGSGNTELPGPTPDDLFDSFCELLANAWFNRLWTFQEASLAKDLVFLSGNHSFSWTNLKAALAIQDTAAKSSSAAVSELWHSFEREPSRTRYSLQEALTMSRYLKCSDPRDRIYALIAVQPKEFDTPYPDYLQSYAQVFVEASAWIIGKEGLTPWVTLATRTSDQESQLPSWVPNWAKVENQLPPWITEAVDTPHKGEVLPVMLKPTVLRVRGRHLETIEHIFWMSDELGMDGNTTNVETRRHVAIAPEILAHRLWCAVTSPQHKMDTPWHSRTVSDWKAGKHATRFTNFCSRGRYHCGRRSWAWMLSNGDTMFGDRTMSDLFAQYCNSHGSTCVVGASAPHDHAEALFEDSLRNMESYSMRIVITADNEFRVAYKSCRAGDEVFLLQGCRLPLLLRRTREGYRLVGELLMDDFGLETHDAVWAQGDATDVDWEGLGYDVLELV